MEGKLRTTAGVLLLMVLLGASDAALLEGWTPFEEEPEVIAETQAPSDPKPPTEEPPRDNDSNLPGVRKHTGPNVLEVLISHSFTFQEGKENIVLNRVVPDDETVHSRTMLLHEDRAGVIAWVESPLVKKYYLILKEALHTAFTAEVEDLLDETQRREGKPTRNLLTFYDPGLLPERVVFVRVRERLYELHIADGASEAIFDLIEELTE